MFSLAVLKVLQIYGITIGISLVVAVLIKLMVLATSRVNKPAPIARAVTPAAAPAQTDIPGEVVAAISAALAVVTGPHRILHIAPSQRSWSAQGRSAQHSHQPQRR